MPGRNCLQAINFYQYGISKIIGSITTWLVNQFNCAVASRREKLKELRPGSVIHGEPRLIWKKIFNHPCKDKSLLLRAKFNAVLEETLCKHRHNYIWNIDQAFIGHPNSFDKTGYLNPTGKIALWNEFDDLLRAFDRDPSKFKPLPVISKASPLPSQPDPNHYHLPPVPPVPHHHKRVFNY